MTDPTPEAPKEPTTEDKKPLSLVYNCHMKGMPPNPHQDWQSYFAHCAATGIISGLRFEAIQPTPSINDTILPETTMTNPTPLSPAAQAVLDAFRTSHTGQGCLAAALRAAADQVVPEENVDDAEYHCLQAKWAAEGEQDARMRFLAIAAELEGAR